MLISNSLLSLGVATTVYAASWIVPGAIWYDTDGNKIDAHGGGIMQRGDTFYWIGQSNSNSMPPLFIERKESQNCVILLPC